MLAKTPAGAIAIHHASLSTRDVASLEVVQRAHALWCCCPFAHVLNGEGLVDSAALTRCAQTEIQLEDQAEALQAVPAIGKAAGAYPLAS